MLHPARAPTGAPHEVARRHRQLFRKIAGNAFRLGERSSSPDQQVTRTAGCFPPAPLLLDLGADAIEIGVVLDDPGRPLPAVDNAGVGEPHGGLSAFTGGEQDAGIDQCLHQPGRGFVVGRIGKRHWTDVEGRTSGRLRAIAGRRHQLPQ